MISVGGVSVASRQSCALRRVTLVAMLAVAFVAANAADAFATFRIEQHTDPAGDPTLFHYVETDTRGPQPNQFDLRDGEHKDFGPFQGIGTAQAVPPAGWRVADIQCVGSHPENFAVDVPNGRVSVNHAIAEEDACAFTLRRISAATGSSPGVAPIPPLNSRTAVIPRRPAVVRVIAGRGFATASVRIPKRSVIKGQLLRGRRVVGVARMVRNAGTHDLVVRLSRTVRAQLRRQGLRRVTLTLRVVVVPRHGATFAFRHGAVVRL